MPIPAMLRWLSLLLAAACPRPVRAQESTPGAPELPWFDAGARGPDYRTPRSGEGFRTSVFGEEVTVPARDRRNVTAWDSAVLVAPGARDSVVTPAAALYVLRDSGKDSLFRLVTAGVFNEVLYARSPEGWGEVEWLATFESLTAPVAQSELVESEPFEAEQTLSGTLRPGLGLGWRRRPVRPGAEDNMLALSLSAEPAYAYYDEGPDAAPDYVAPQDGFDGRLHGRFLWDAMTRNLLELPHEGFGMGAEVVYGYRPNWEDWGQSRRHSGSKHRDYGYFSGWLMGASGVPGVPGDRHRLFGTVHGSTGDDLDRWSAPRLGGGIDARGEEFVADRRPLLPGAVFDEFHPDFYAVALGEYRYEPIFFTFLGPRAGLAYLDRPRRSPPLEEEDDLLATLGFKATSGFLGDTRLQIDYAYLWSLQGDDGFRRHSVLLRVSGSF